MFARLQKCFCQMRFINIDIDECVTQACYENGECVNHVGSFSCISDFGYLHCQGMLTPYGLEKYG